MQEQKSLFATVNLIKIALLAVIAVILMQFGAIKLPTLFPSFLEIDLSEVPAIIGSLTIHPMAGLVVVVLKNILKITLFQSSTAYVGELANMIVSLGYIFPLALLTRRKRHLKQVGFGLAMGVIVMTLVGAAVNYWITIPLYAKLFMPMETIIEMGHVIFPKIVDKGTLILYSLVPFNLVKGSIVAFVSVILVKGLKPVLVQLGYRASSK